LSDIVVKDLSDQTDERGGRTAKKNIIPSPTMSDDDKNNSLYINRKNHRKR